MSRPAVPTTEPAKATCPCCRRRHRVRKNGTLFKHYSWGWECHGSGAKPYTGNYRGGVS